MSSDLNTALMMFGKWIGERKRVREREKETEKDRKRQAQ